MPCYNCSSVDCKVSNATHLFSRLFHNCNLQASVAHNGGCSFGDCVQAILFLSPSYGVIVHEIGFGSQMYNAELVKDTHIIKMDTTLSSADHSSARKIVPWSSLYGGPGLQNTGEVIRRKMYASLVLAELWPDLTVGDRAATYVSYAGDTFSREE